MKAVSVFFDITKNYVPKNKDFRNWHLLPMEFSNKKELADFIADVAANGREFTCGSVRSQKKPYRKERVPAGYIKMTII